MKNQTETRPYCSYFRTGEEFGAANPRGVSPVRRGGPEPGLYWEGCLPKAIKNPGSQKMKLNQVELKPHCWGPTCISSSCNTSVQVSPICNCIAYVALAAITHSACMLSRPECWRVDNFSPPSPSND